MTIKLNCVIVCVIYANVRFNRCTNEANLISLNCGKILHNIYPTKVLLCKMGQESDSICHTCNAVDHFFFDCVNINQLWTLARHIISRNLSKNLRLTVEDVMVNYQNTNCNLSDFS